MVYDVARMILAGMLETKAQELRNRSNTNAVWHAHYTEQELQDALQEQLALLQIGPSPANWLKTEDVSRNLGEVWKLLFGEDYKPEEVTPLDLLTAVRAAYLKHGGTLIK